MFEKHDRLFVRLLHQPIQRFYVGNRLKMFLHYVLLPAVQYGFDARNEHCNSVDMPKASAARNSMSRAAAWLPAAHPLLNGCTADKEEVSCLSL